jgi:hypothetical protein
MGFSIYDLRLAIYERRFVPRDVLCAVPENPNPVAADVRRLNISRDTPRR